MLNEFIELFLGAYFNFVPADYVDRYFFASIICVIVIGLLLACVFGVVLLTIHHTFISSRKGMK